MTDPIVTETLTSLALPVPAGIPANLPVRIAETPGRQLQEFHEEQQRTGKQMTPAQAEKNQVYVNTLSAAKALSTPARMDANGMVASELVVASGLTFGYKLPPGIKVNANSVYATLSVARKAGFDQSIVDRFLAAQMELDK